MRKFETGATRNSDSNKLDYEAFLSPAVLHRYAEYMHEHRKQSDGSLRDGDNWQKGIPKDAYRKSLVRHTVDFWRLERGLEVIDPDNGHQPNKQELLCAIIFNAMGRLYEELKDEA